ncbi:hypothetical protein C8Q79DRAFT_483171 [Trametes meyenii]|nr:hypothetical protein C8Q79DRAFT_483171 [Trametes meyenii]
MPLISCRDEWRRGSFYSSIPSIPARSTRRNNRVYFMSGCQDIRRFHRSMLLAVMFSLDPLCLLPIPRSGERNIESGQKAPGPPARLRHSVSPPFPPRHIQKSFLSLYENSRSATYMLSSANA